MDCIRLLRSRFGKKLPGRIQYELFVFKSFIRTESWLYVLLLGLRYGYRHLSNSWYKNNPLEIFSFELKYMSHLRSHKDVYLLSFFCWTPKCYYCCGSYKNGVHYSVLIFFGSRFQILFDVKWWCKKIIFQRFQISMFVWFTSYQQA